MKRPSLRRFRPRRKTDLSHFTGRDISRPTLRRHRQQPVRSLRERPHDVLAVGHAHGDRLARLHTRRERRQRADRRLGSGGTVALRTIGVDRDGWFVRQPATCSKLDRASLRSRDRWRCPNPSADSGANRRMDDYQSGLPPAGGCQDYRLSSVGKGNQSERDRPFHLPHASIRDLEILACEDASDRLATIELSAFIRGDGRGRLEEREWIRATPPSSGPGAQAVPAA